MRRLGRAALTAHRREQIGDLGAVELAERSRALVTERDRTEAGTHQVLDGEPGLGEEAADDVLAALVQDDLDQRASVVDVEEGELVDLRRAVLQLDALAQLLAESLAHDAGHGRHVGLGHLVRGVHEAVRQLAVVRHQQQSLGVGVEASDVEQPLPGVDSVGHEIADAGAPALVGHGRVDTARLVQREVDHLLVKDDPGAVDADHRGGGIDLETHLADDLAIHLDPAPGDEVLGGAP